MAMKKVTLLDLFIYLGGLLIAFFGGITWSMLLAVSSAYRARSLRISSIQLSFFLIPHIHLGVMLFTLSNYFWSSILVGLLISY